MAKLYYLDNNGSVKPVPPDTIAYVSLIQKSDVTNEWIEGYNYRIRVDEDGILRFD